MRLAVCACASHVGNDDGTLNVQDEPKCNGRVCVRCDLEVANFVTCKMAAANNKT